MLTGDLPPFKKISLTTDGTDGRGFLLKEIF